MKDRRIMMKLKRILSAILAGATVLCTTALPAFAGDAETGSGEPATVAAIRNTAYSTFEEAVTAAKDDDTITLTDNVTVDTQTVINNNITIDLNGNQLVSNYTGNYAFIFKNGGTIKDSANKQGALIATNARAISANGKKLTVSNAVVKVVSNNEKIHAVLAANNGLLLDNSEVIGECPDSYAVCSFADYNTFTIKNSTIKANGIGIYHNGSNTNFKMTVDNSTVTIDKVGEYEVKDTYDAQGIYVSGTKGLHDIKITDSTISGKNGIEVKYANVTLDNATVTSTVTEPSYVQNNNGPATKGFAVVITDNTKGDNNKTVDPRGTIIINSGTYTGLIGLESFKASKEYLAEGAKTDVRISGGTFNQPLEASWCADGYEPADNGDGTYTVKEKSAVKLFDKIAVLRGKEPWLFAGIDKLNYDKAGFKFKIGDGEEFEVLESVVCEEITCNGEPVKASDLGGSYIFGVKLDERFKAAFTAAPFADGQVGTATKFMKYVDDLPGDNGVDPSDWL